MQGTWHVSGKVTHFLVGYTDHEMVLEHLDGLAFDWKHL